MISIMSLELLDLFADMPSRKCMLGAGDYLFRQDDRIVHMHLVTEGEVHLVRHLPHGGRIVLQRAGPGALLAEASLYSTSYHCDAVAAQAACTLACDKRAMAQLLDSKPGYATAFARHLALQVQAARQRAEIVSLRTVREKLDAWLAVNNGTLPEKGQWKLVAHEIACSPEALYREMSARRDGAC